MKKALGYTFTGIAVFILIFCLCYLFIPQVKNQVNGWVSPGTQIEQPGSDIIDPDIDIDWLEAYNALSEEHEQLKLDYNNAINELDTTKTNLADTQDKLNKTQSALDEQKQLSITQQNKISELETNLSDVTFERNSLQSELEIKNAKIEELEADKTANEAEIISLTDEVTTLNQQVSNLNTNIATLTKQIQLLNDDIDTKNNDIINLNDKIANLESQADSDAEEIATLKAQVSELQTEVSNLTTERDELQVQLSNLNIELTEKNNTILSLETQIKELQRITIELTNQIETLQGEIADLERELDTAQQLISQLTTQLNTVTAELEEAQATIQTLEDEKATLTETVSGLQDDILGCQNQVSDLQATIAQLNIKIAELEAKIAELEGQADVTVTTTSASYFDFDGNTILGLSSKGQQMYNSGLLTEISIPKSYSLGEVTTIEYVFNSEEEAMEYRNRIMTNNDYLHQFEEWYMLNNRNYPATYTATEQLYVDGDSNDVTSTAMTLFYGLTNLETVIIPNTITSIGRYPFENCDNLSKIVVEDGNPIYDSRNNCDAIIETASNTLIVGCKNTIIPNNVTEIGDFAFYYCNGLKHIVIPESVTRIGNNAFTVCPNLISVTMLSSTPPSIVVRATFNTNLTLILVPEQALETYRTTGGWVIHKDIIQSY